MIHLFSTVSLHEERSKDEKKENSADRDHHIDSHDICLHLIIGLHSDSVCFFLCFLREYEGGYTVCAAEYKSAAAIPYAVY